MADVIKFPRGGVLQLGNHMELASVLIDEDSVDGHRPVTDEVDEYHIWDAGTGLWEPCAQRRLLCRVDEFSGAPVQGANDKILALKIRESDSPATVRIMLRNTWRGGFFRDDLIAFNNGLVARCAGNEVFIDELCAEHGARVMIDVAYDDTWEMPEDCLLAHYLSTTFPDPEEQTRVIEVLGAALMGIGTRCKKAWMLTDGPEVDGQGGTGKSQFLELLSGLVPRSRRCSIPPQLFADDYHGADLYGKTLNVVFEAPDTEILKEEGVKAIVHGEVIRRRHIRGKPFEFSPSALHAFSVNRLPEAPGATGAFWERWELLEFCARFRGTADAIHEIGKRIVAEEMTHLVHAALIGASRIMSQHKYSDSVAGADALTRWRLSADPVAAFLAQWCVKMDEQVGAHWTSSIELYDGFKRWCESRGRRPCSHKKFGQRMNGVPKTKSMGLAKYQTRLMTRAERAIQDGEHAETDW